MHNLLQLETLQTWWGLARRGRAQRIIVALVLFASLVLALVASERIYLLLAAGLIAVTGVLLIIQYPALVIYLIVASAITVPLEMRGGLNLPVILIAGLLVLWLLDMLIRQRSIHFASSSTNLALIAFIISAIISFGIGQIPWYPVMTPAPLSAQFGGFLIFLLSAVAFLLVGNLFRDTRWLEALTWVFIFFAGLYVFGRLVPPAGRFLRLIFQPGATTGSLFWVWMFVLPFSQALLNRSLRMPVRIAFISMVLAAMYVAVIRASDWKSGYIPPLAGIMVITAFWLKKRILYLLPFALPVVWFVTQQAISTDQYSYTTRMDAWKIVFDLSMINPILGLGFANYYWYTPLYAISGYFVNFNSHSQFIDILAQTGLVGMVCFFWVFWSIWKLGWRLQKQAAEGFQHAFVVGALGGLVGTLVAALFVDWVLPFAYNIGMSGFRSSVLSWLFLGGLVSMEQIINKQNNSQTEESNSSL